MHVDWTTPANSTLTGPTLLSAPYVDACTGLPHGPNGGCIPQPGTTQLLDPLNTLAMYRLAYRNIGDHESLVINVSVEWGSGISSTVGVDWYEIRNPNTTPIIYQQGTYAPDANFRWVGSIATDQAGDMAMGFSLSSSTVYPSIHYAGRLAGDPLGQMAQGAGTIVDGGASQVGDASTDLETYRWGDYTSMAIDPTDDCTFWYTGEYIPSGAPPNTDSTPNYRTRIASFKFPSCGVSTPTPTPSATPTNTVKNTAAPTAMPTETAINTPTATETLVPPTNTATNTATN
jgi:hypothetical protein